MYADIHNYDAAMVPPEWHSWLHHMTDAPGDDSAAYIAEKIKERVELVTHSDAPYGDHLGKSGARGRVSRVPPRCVTRRAFSRLSRPQTTSPSS